MTKNEFIEERVKEFKHGFLHDKKFVFYDYLRQSLEEAWLRGQEFGIMTEEHIIEVRKRLSEQPVPEIKQNPKGNVVQST